MMAAILAGLAGIPVGFLIDAVSRRLAHAWHAIADEELAKSDDSDEPPMRVLGTRWLLEGGATLRRGGITSLTVALYAVVGARYPEAWQIAVVCAYLAVLIACSSIDVMAHRIPDVITYPAMIAALAVSLLAPSASISEVLLGGLIGGGLLLAYVLFLQLGVGDAKLGLFMGLALGVRLLVPAMLITAIVGGVFALGLLVATFLRGGFAAASVRIRAPIPRGQNTATGPATRTMPIFRRVGSFLAFVLGLPVVWSFLAGGFRSAFGARRTPIPYGPYIAIGMAAVTLVQGTAFYSF